MSFKERLESLINDKCNGSKSDFAAQIETDPSTVRLWSEERLPTGRILLKISNVFSVNTNWLLSGEGEPYIGQGQEKAPAGYTEKELALIRTLRLCGDEYKKRIYIAATIRAQNAIEERKIETKEKLKAQKDLETLSTASVE